MAQDTILIVDDEPYEICSAAGALEGIEILKNNPVKVVLSDEKMPDITGSEFLAMVREQFPDVIRIMLTGNASIDAAMKAINKGEIYRFFTKPWDDRELKFAVSAAVDKYNIEEENRRLLEIVKRQALNMKLLERQFPGITKLERDEKDRILLPDVSEQEMTRIMAKFDKEFI